MGGCGRQINGRGRERGGHGVSRVGMTTELHLYSAAVGKERSRDVCNLACHGELAVGEGGRLVGTELRVRMTIKWRERKERVKQIKEGGCEGPALIPGMKGGFAGCGCVSSLASRCHL